MKQVPVSQEDLVKYSDILNEKPMRYRKINEWWREMVQKYSLDLEHEWSINFAPGQLIGKDKK